MNEIRDTRIFRGCAAALVLAGALVGCTGEIGAAGVGSGSGNVGPGGRPGAPGDPQGTDVAGTTFTCDPAAAPSQLTMPRLTNTQYRNTLRDLLKFSLQGSAAADAAMGELAAALDKLPADKRKIVPQDPHGAYRRMDQDVDQVHVDGVYELATAVSSALTKPDRLQLVVGSCATGNGDATTCVGDFIRRFGEKALRHPLTADDVVFWTKVYGSTTISVPGFAAVISVMLQSPEFFYRVEHGTADATRPEVFRLDGFELASRLSYHFWQSAPDDALLAAAKSGALTTDAGYQAEVQRIFQDPRTRAAIDEFYDDWLKLDDVAPLDSRNGEPFFQAFAGSDLPTPDLRSHVIDDAMDLLRYFTWTRPGSGLGDVLTTDLTFARASDVARIEGVPVWDGQSAPVAAPGGNRIGLLDRPALLASASGKTRPIMRGVFIRKGILCDSIPAPPANAMAVAMMTKTDPMMTQRQIVETITETPGSNCAGCHATAINPLGFAMEEYDALGRFRSEERVLSDTGQELQRVPVNARSVPAVTTGDKTEVQGSRDLMRRITESGKADTCLARNYFRFSFGRWEDDQIDGCVLGRIWQSLRGSDGSLPGMLKAVALSPEFKERSFR